MKKDSFKQKHILFDSCVVAELFKDINSLKNLLEIFEKSECILCINDFVKLEFLRIARKKTEYDKLEHFLDQYFLLLPTTPEIYKNAFQLASLYNLCHIGKTQISTTDCVNGAFLSRYSQNLLLLTFDIYDYPIEVFNRMQVGVSDLGKKVITWGVYKFNQTRYDAKIRIFQNN